MQQLPPIDEFQRYCTLPVSARHLHQVPAIRPFCRNDKPPGIFMAIKNPQRRQGICLKVQGMNDMSTPQRKNEHTVHPRMAVSSRSSASQRTLGRFSAPQDSAGTIQNAQQRPEKHLMDTTRVDGRNHAHDIPTLQEGLQRYVVPRLRTVRFCKVMNCTKQSQQGGLCKKHGGGKRCTYAGCDKSSQSGGFCRRHGGGETCSAKGCTTGTQVGGLCHRVSLEKCL